MILAFVYRAANSISEITGMPCSLIFCTMGTLSGIPGLFITSSACRTRSWVCIPSSKSIRYSCNVPRCLSCIFPLSERNTSKPFARARMAAPTPLSPPPKTTIRLLFISFSFLPLGLPHLEGSQCQDHQDHAHQPEAAHDLWFGQRHDRLLYARVDAPVAGLLEVVVQGR